MVQIVTGVVDYGDAAEVYVSRIGRVTRISNSVVRISFCVEREGPQGVERRVVLHVLHDLDEMAVELERLRKAIETVSNEPPLNGDALRLAEWH